MSTPEGFDCFLSASDWMFLMEILWLTRSPLFPIKKPFGRGSSGSHASKYIHFHRKCFVLEVHCFLGLLSLRLDSPLPSKPDPPTLHNGEHKQNPLLKVHRLVICKESAPEKTTQTGGSLSCGMSMCLPRCTCYKQTNKTQGSTNQQGNLQYE